MAYSLSKHLPVALFAAVVLSCACVPHAVAARELVDRSMVERHEKWMASYGRIYRDAIEQGQRLEIFRSNVGFIESFNAENHKFSLAVNQFADLTNDEFKAVRIGFRPSVINKMATGFKYDNISVDDVPATMDWRTKGAVTPVKNQGTCECCWAFSAVAAMEGIVQLSTGKLISLSEQELVDCDVQGINQGCDGGLEESAFEFIISNGGLTSETNYPYKEVDGTCDSSKASNSTASIKGYEDVPANDEAALLKAVAHQPVSVAVDAGDPHFNFYSGGILSGNFGSDLNHAITAVGYGTAADGTKYWLMKNSWGAAWGENGYIRMERDVADKRGVCGLAMEASYPTT